MSPITSAISNAMMGMTGADYMGGQGQYALNSVKEEDDNASSISNQ